MQMYLLPRAETFNHGDQNQVCIATKWTNILVFFLANYVAHAATTVVLPGSSVVSSTFNAVAALLFPVIGVNRGLEALFRFSILFGAVSGSELQTAARAGALCKVVRLEEYAQMEREWALTKGVRRREIGFWRKLFVGKVHGRIFLPEGYGLAIVPRDAKSINDASPNVMISSHYSVIKVMVAVVQLVFSSLTLYHTVGVQIDRYGYAAFGLTVAQYAIMSFINLIAALVTPQYPAVYLVETDLMNECKDNHPDAIFEGVVGRLDEHALGIDRDKKKQPYEGDLFAIFKFRYWWLPIALTPGAIAVVVIWALSRFQPASSTPTQRRVLMLWLGLGSWTGALGDGFPISAERRQNILKPKARFLRLGAVGLLLAFYAAPAVWGFVIVAKMLEEFGACVYLQ